MVPLDVEKPFSSFLNASISDAVGNKLQWSECPVGFLICLDYATGKVSYKDTNSENKVIPTDFTEQHINIAHRDFHPTHPNHIAWDEFNSMLAKGKREWYKAKDK